MAAHCLQLQLDGTCQSLRQAPSHHFAGSRLHHSHLQFVARMSNQNVVVSVTGGMQV
jgi:hypothetical protein